MHRPPDRSAAPLVSLLMPSFNAEVYLPRTLESLMQQEFQDWELIVHDGGSTDDTLDILATYARRSGGRIHVESASDDGQSDALNRAMLRATGTWLGWLNSDDLLMPGALSNIATAALRDNPVAPEVIYGDWAIIDKQDALLRAYTVNAWDWKSFFGRGSYIFSGSIFYHRNVLSEVGGWDPSLHYAMDLDLALRVGSRDCVRVDAVLSALRWHAEAKSSNAGWRFMAEGMRVRSTYAKSPRLKWAMAKATTVMAISTLTSRLRFGKAYSRVRPTVKDTRGKLGSARG